MVCLLRVFARCFAVMPRGCALACGRVLGWIYGHIIRYHRRDACAALAKAFPTWSIKRVQETVNAMYRNLGLNVVEFFRVMGGRAAELDETVVFHDEAHLEEALARGRGVLALVSHVGNWECLAVAMARRYQPSGMVVKDMKYGPVSDYFIRKRREQGTIVFPRRGAYRACLKALREKTLIGFVLDQNMMWKEGLFVEFFGRPACTTPGLAHLAARAQCPVVPIFIYREEDGRHHIQVQPALEPPANRDPEVIHEATQHYTAIIEAAIRKHPEQWIWIHRRWRTTPDKVEQKKKLKSTGAAANA